MPTNSDEAVMGLCGGDEKPPSQDR
ncbi:hypothetical protein A2U01_0064365, partial [Trifolium medium]|nr:hypothetical protein [Trifolium medium]